MENETTSSANEQVSSSGGGDTSVVADKRGKHRILAQLKHVDLEIKSLQEELEELDRTDNVSIFSEELFRSIETVPDPLLSETPGPANPLWDRWFEGSQEAKGHRCCIL